MLEVPDDPLFLSPGMKGTGGSTEQPLAGSYKSVRRFNLYIFYLVTLPCKCPYYRLQIKGRQSQLAFFVYNYKK